MTTTTAPPCGHRWQGAGVAPTIVPHRCTLPAGHHTAGPNPRRCRCHCGAVAETKES